MGDVVGWSPNHFSKLFQSESVADIRFQYGNHLADSKIHDVALKVLEEVVQQLQHSPDPANMTHFKELATKYQELFGKEVPKKIQEISNAILMPPTKADTTVSPQVQPIPKTTQTPTRERSLRTLEVMKMIKESTKATDVSTLFKSQKASIDELHEAAWENCIDLVLDDSLDEENFKKAFETEMMKLSGIRKVGVTREDVSREIAGRANEICEFREHLVKLFTPPPSALSASELQVLKELLSDISVISKAQSASNSVNNAFQGLITAEASKIDVVLARECSPAEKLEELVTIQRSLTLIADLADDKAVKVPKEAKNKLSSYAATYVTDCPSKTLQLMQQDSTQELTIEDMQWLAWELSTLESFDIELPYTISLTALEKTVKAYVESNKQELQENPALATKAHNILHQLAQNKLENNDVKGCMQLRSFAATTIPLSNTNPLHSMDAAIHAGTSNTTLKNFGANFSGLNSGILKCGTIHALRRNLDGNTQNCLDFRIGYRNRDQLEKTLAVLEDAEGLQSFKAGLPDGLCQDVSVSRNESYTFRRYGGGDNYSTKNGYTPAESECMVVEFKGLGRVIIGMAPTYGNLHNWINVEMNADLPPGEGLAKLNQALTMLGMGPIVGQQPPDSAKRIQVAQLLHAFYPALGTQLDRKEDFYTLPLDLLIKRIGRMEPGMNEVFNRYFDESPHLLGTGEILPGKSLVTINDLGDQVRAAGAWGLMCGVGSGNDENANDTVVSILTHGAFSTMDRLSAGMIFTGASTDEDIAGGGADSVFTRMINPEVANNDVTEFSFSGRIQVVIDADAVNYGAYAFPVDNYGTRREGHGNFQEYQSRENLMQLAGSLQNGHVDNEVMIKHLNPRFVKALMVQKESQKQTLINRLKPIAKPDPTGTLMINEVPLDRFIVVGTRFEKQMWRRTT